MRAKFTRFPRAAGEPPRSFLAAGSLLARFFPQESRKFRTQQRSAPIESRLKRKL